MELNNANAAPKSAEVPVNTASIQRKIARVSLVDRAAFKAAERRLSEKTKQDTELRLNKRNKQKYESGSVTVDGKSLSEANQEIIGSITIDNQSVVEYYKSIANDPNKGEKLAELAKRIHEQIKNSDQEISLPNNLFHKELNKNINDDANQESLKKEEVAAQEAMRKLVLGNMKDAAHKLKQVDKKQLRLTLDLENQENNALKENPRSISTANEDNTVAQVLKELSNLDQEREEIANQSPDHYVTEKRLLLRKYKKQFESGGVVITPYIGHNIAIVKECMRKSEPTFVHGHLGSGKTEMVTMAAKEVALHKATMKEAKERARVVSIQKMIEAMSEGKEYNPNEGFSELLAEEYENVYTEYERQLKRGDETAVQKFKPILISGSKETTTQDLFAEKSLTLEKLNTKEVREQQAEVNREFEKWKKENPSATQEEIDRNFHAILELYKNANSGFGTVVKTIENGILQGMREGRPVIIDEVNAIPANILIGLNNILTRKPGDTVTIPGVEGPVTVADGFSITMTGNLNSGQNNGYAGTNEMNVAFMSRLTKIEHDYLPMSDITNYDTAVGNGKGSNKGNQSTDGNKPKGVEKNELFHAVMAYFIDEQANLQLPDIANNIRKIYNLTVLAHDTQKIFEGKWKKGDTGPIKTASGREVEPKLSNTVLSIRNILDVLKNWNRGAAKSLDTALWDGYISQVENQDERNLLLALANQRGFFNSSDGWKVQVKDIGQPAPSTIDELREDESPVFYNRPAVETYDPRKTIQAIFGFIPQREIYPDDIELEITDEDEEEEVDFNDPETIQEARETIQKVENAIKALEILGEQCGCKKVESA